MGEGQVLYFIKDHKGICHAYTETEFYRQIMDDAKSSDHNWCAPVMEIAKAVGKFKNQLFKDSICRAVLDCFSHLIMQDSGYDEGTNIAIWECFMELSPDSMENRQSQVNYVNKYLNFEIMMGSTSHLHMHGENWQKFRQDFIDEKNREWPKFHSAREIIKWADNVGKDFARRLKKAENEKLFEEEDKEIFRHIVNTTARAWQIPD